MLINRTEKTRENKEKTCAGCYYLGYDSLGRAECIAGLDKQCACNGHVFWTKTDIIKRHGAIQ